MKCVNETLNNIKIECGMNPNEEKMEEGLRLFVSRGDNIDTLGELLQHNRDLEKIVDDISKCLYYSGDIIIRK